jgi:hypothetical protein
MMVTTGSKLYLGLASIAGLVLVVLGWATRWAMQPTLGAASAMLAFALLGGLCLYIRDDDAIAEEGAPAEVTPAPRHAAWSLAAAFGVAVAAIGLPIDTRLFIGGLIVVGLAIVEWAVQSWADRASSDPAYNDRLRGRLMHPLEFPAAGLLCGGLIVFGFSRVMVALSKNGAIVAFAVLGVTVMGIAALLGTRPDLSRKVLGGVLGVSAVALIAGGVAGIGHGERKFEEHESACESNSKGSKTVADKASVASVLTFDGTAFDPDSVVAGRNVVFNAIFKNASDSDTQFVVHAGQRDKLDANGNPVKTADGQTVKENVEYCTNLVRPTTQQALTVTFLEPGSYEYDAQSESGETLATGTAVVP